MSSRFPTVVISIISFPFDKILILIIILVAVKDIFNIIFKFIIDFDRWRERWVKPID